ncbi:hypothetical protein QYM36_004673 [Artemia franciscana]|uniref:Uncharacterized protein n=1 Tax=Artemia franciscana TaxID=6661 RepID=A0AA88LC96_ARTSF|nr:hypothetical protein QYM36_004673 [Artemia franciscana]
MRTRAKKCLTEDDIIQILEEDDDLSSGSDTQNYRDYGPSNDKQENRVPKEILSSKEITEESSEANILSSQLGEQSLRAPGQPDLDDVPLSRRTRRWTCKDVLLGRVRTTKWSKSAPHPSQTRAINMGTERAGPKGPARTGKPLQPETARGLLFPENIIDAVVDRPVTTSFLDLKTPARYMRPKLHKVALAV